LKGERKRERDRERERERDSILRYYIRGVTAKMGLDGTVHQSNLS
jgi:hypothetical protein